MLTVLYKANTWNVSSSGWWKIHDKRIAKQTKTLGGRKRHLTVPLMLNKSRFLLKNYNTGDTGNLLINVVQGNAFLMEKRLSENSDIQEFDCIICIHHLYPFIGSYGAHCKTAETCFYCAGFLVFDSSESRKSFVYIILHWYCDLFYAVFIQFSSTIIGAMINILMLHLNLIILQLWPAVMLMNSLNNYHCRVIVYFGCVLNAANRGPHKRTLACMVKQNIHETHNYPYSSLISELLLQLSGWCSTLHATEWIIDFLPTWEIPLSEYHTTSPSPNICKKCPSSGEIQMQNHTTIFFNASLKCLPDE